MSRSSDVRVRSPFLVLSLVLVSTAAASPNGALGWGVRLGALGPRGGAAADGRERGGMAQYGRPTGVLLASGTLPSGGDWRPLCAPFGRREAGPRCWC